MCVGGEWYEVCMWCMMCMCVECEWCICVVCICVHVCVCMNGVQVWYVCVCMYSM
jgi:hypothetical protein